MPVKVQLGAEVVVTGGGAGQPSALATAAAEALVLLGVSASQRRQLLCVPCNESGEKGESFHPWLKQDLLKLGFHQLILWCQG